jgi:hypothetical protein
VKRSFSQDLQHKNKRVLQESARSIKVTYEWAREKEDSAKADSVADTPRVEEEAIRARRAVVHTKRERCLLTKFSVWAQASKQVTSNWCHSSSLTTSERSMKTEK